MSEAVLPWSVKLNEREIIVKRDERQRKELVGLEELGQSIMLNGQIQPIVITRDNVLIAGERRLAAIRLMKLREVKCVYRDEVDAATLKALEFEENAKRIDLPWKDKCLAVQEYHSIRSSQDPEWSQAKTARALSLSAKEISELLEVAQAVASGNKLVAEAPKLSTAKGIVKRATERREAAQTSELTSLLSPKPVKAQPEGVVEAEKPSGTGLILNLSFHDWASTYDGNKFNLIQCDFPYGVGMDKSDQGSGDAYGTYEDTPDIYWALVDTLLLHLDNFCEESAHLIFWFSMDYYAETLARLSSKFRVNPFPLVWHKSDGSGILPDPNRGPRRTYETAFFASRGDRKIVRAVSNSVGAPIQRGRHMSEKPQEVLRHFFRMVVDEHSSVFDPTCGSGSALRAGLASGASRVLGLELNPEFAAHADELLRDQIESADVPLPLEK